MKLSAFKDQVIELEISVRFTPNRFHGSISGRVREVLSDYGINYWVGDFCFGPDAEVEVTKSIVGNYDEIHLYVE